MLRELDSRRTPEGDVIALWWDDETDAVQVGIDQVDGESHTFAVDPERAYDAFQHPWAYMPAHV